MSRNMWPNIVCSTRVLFSGYSTILRNPSAGKKRDGPFWFKKMRWNTKNAIKPKNAIRK